MNKKIRYVKCFIFFCLLFSFSKPACLSADEEDTRDKHQDIQQGTTKQAPAVSGIKDRLSYNFYIGALEGYDNNVYLNPSRKGDTFDQVMADAVFRYRLNDRLDIKAQYDFTSITYHRYTDVSMLDNQILASFEYYPQNRFKIEAGYLVDFIDYLKGKDSDYMLDGPFAGLRYYLNKKTYMGGMYQYGVYDYRSRKTRNSSDQETDITRKDKRNTVIAEFATSIGKLFVKIKNTYFWNDSNDQYLDFYDYNSERINLYTAYPINSKLTLLLNGGYQRKDFKSRTTIKDPSKKEHDNIMILGGGVSYKLMPSCSLSLNYSYRQNYSNDPIQDYSGSIGTLGVNIFF
jgi:opacity protein-like surface antigen